MLSSLLQLVMEAHPNRPKRRYRTQASSERMVHDSGTTTGDTRVWVASC